MNNKKVTIEEMHNIAESKNGKCLSSNYINSKTELKWQCNKGHFWEATPGHIKSGSWCPKCSGNVKMTIEDAHNLAFERSGKCLSKKYINNHYLLEWECSRGHTWKSSFKSIKNGAWCLKCFQIDKPKKFNIYDMQNLARSKGGYCLSSEYINSSTKLKWKCKKGHIWEAAPNDIKQKSWCPECVGKRITIQDMYKLAESKGGKCLSTKYINIKSELEWQCSKGHIWKSAPNNVRNSGYWCRICSSRPIISIEDMHKLAESKGGKCLSIKYINSHTPLKWQCKEGHQWESKPLNVRNSGHWCHECSGVKKLTIKDIHQLAESRGGKCLSNEYQNINSIIKWECKEGHQWESKAHNVRYGNWCSTCSKKKKHTIDEIHKLAELKGGKCLSNEYINTSTKLKFECSKKHIFNLRAGNLIQGQWCRTCGNFESSIKRLTPFEYIKQTITERGFTLLSSEYKGKKFPLEIKCPLNHICNMTFESFRKSVTGCSICSKSRHVSENVCRIHFETIFKEKFPTIKPKWLRSNLGNPMELDGYSKKLGIAFEYQGRQHYEDGRGFFSKNNQTLEKRIENDKQKVVLCKDNNVKLFVIKYDIPYEKISEEIKLQAKKFGLDISNYDFNLQVDLTEASVLSKFNEVQELAKLKELECLSDYYLNGNTTLKFKCKNNHVFEMKASRLRDKRIKNNFCTQCLKGKPGFNVKYSIEDIKKLAENRNGLFLSDKYDGVNIKYKWQCEKGHIWDARAAWILQNKWCRICNSEILKSPKQILAKEMYEQGINISLIAEELNVSSTNIGSWAKKYKWQRLKQPEDLYRNYSDEFLEKTKSLYEVGKTNIEIANALNLCNGTIGRMAKKYKWKKIINTSNWVNGLPYSMETIDKARNLYEQGMVNREILIEVGIKDLGTLSRWIKKYSWKRKKEVMSDMGLYNKIKNLYESGESISSISKIITEKSYNTISRWAKKYNWQRQEQKQ